MGFDERAEHQQGMPTPAAYLPDHAQLAHSLQRIAAAHHAQVHALTAVGGLYLATCSGQRRTDAAAAGPDPAAWIRSRWQAEATMATASGDLYWACLTQLFSQKV